MKKLQIIIALLLLSQIFSKCWTSSEKNSMIGTCIVKITYEDCYDLAHGYRYRVWIRSGGRESYSGYCDARSQAEAIATQDWKNKYKDCGI
jgi:hypothetical protein